MKNLHIKKSRNTFSFNRSNKQIQNARSKSMKQLPFQVDESVERDLSLYNEVNKSR